jgi:hypothetical protein
MARRSALAEANRSGHAAVRVGKHSLCSTFRPRASLKVVSRMPPQYTCRDVAFLLDALWSMFTESQSRQLTVAVPWDDSDEPRHMVLADLAELLSSWLE